MPPTFVLQILGKIYFCEWLKRQKIFRIKMQIYFLKDFRNLNLEIKYNILWQTKSMDIGWNLELQRSYLVR